MAAITIYLSSGMTPAAKWSRRMLPADKAGEASGLTRHVETLLARSPRKRRAFLGALDARAKLGAEAAAHFSIQAERKRGALCRDIRFRQELSVGRPRRRRRRRRVSPTIG